MSADAMDVLAVIRSRANRTDCGGLAVVDETLLDAANAVAELIEDATLALELLESDGHSGGYTAGLLRASIARVGGAS